MKGEFSKLTIMTLTIGDDSQMGLQNSLVPELNLRYLQEKTKKGSGPGLQSWVFHAFPLKIEMNAFFMFPKTRKIKAMKN